MKTLVISLLLVVGSLVLPPAPVAAQQGYEPPLTNNAVVKLVRAGFREKTIIAIIQSRPTRFSLDPDRLIELKRSGVSENIILAMLSQDEAFSMTGDEWGDNWSLGGNGTGNQPRGESGSAEIFGGSQGSRGQTRSKGTRGGTQEDLSTTGSATVRIMRPPTESGNATPKLEKTPTLDNESIVKLVEAGFSEGTIIKRIEESPGEFDLSEASTRELRRRRVTEPVIAAMMAAMKDESVAPSKTKVN